MATITLNIPDTTFVSSAQPDNNLSYSPMMYVGTEQSFLNCIGFLKIAIPTLPVNQVDSAKLRLAVIVKSGEAPSPILINRVTESFSTSTVTYNTQPAFVSTTSQVNVTTTDLYTSVEFDVTFLVNSWLSGSSPNEGIALTNSDGTTVVQFATNAIVYEPYFPQLVLTYASSPEESSALCFSYHQLANVIQQLISFYPTATFTVYTKGFNAAGITGTAVALYSSPDASYGTLFILRDGEEYGTVPLNTITAISIGDGTVYNPSITYLDAPDFPAGCDKNLITAYHDYLPVSTDVHIYAGALIQATGTVFRNEYGLLVLADAAGNNPSFIPVINITAIITTESGGSQDAKILKRPSSNLIISGESLKKIQRN